MATNNDLTPNQNAGPTGNPQTVDSNVGATDPSSFQQSAGVDSLDQNRPISVLQTGKPVNGTVLHGNSLALMWLFIVVASIVLIMFAIAVFKWVMKQPEQIEEENIKANKIVTSPKQNLNPRPLPSPVLNSVKPTIVRPQGKKKLSRSKRNKK